MCPLKLLHQVLVKLTGVKCQPSRLQSLLGTLDGLSSVLVHLVIGSRPPVALVGIGQVRARLGSSLLLAGVGEYLRRLSQRLFCRIDGRRLFREGLLQLIETALGLLDIATQLLTRT